MTKIIRKDFTIEDYKKVVQEFLFSDTRVSLSKESLLNLLEHLLKAGPSFQKVFIPYFEGIDNKRYDNLTSLMVSFSKRLMKYNGDLQGDERKVFILFWKEVGELIKADYLLLQDQYLKNSCNYFIYEINQLS